MRRIYKITGGCCLIIQICFCTVPNRRPPLDLTSPFLKLSDTLPSRAIFSIAPYYERVEIDPDWLDRRTVARMVFLGEDREENLAAPSVCVALRRLANDTPLCDWELDLEQLEISLDWRKTLSALLWEEKLRTTLSSRWVS
jgi:hypothetical protein